MTDLHSMSLLKLLQGFVDASVAVPDLPISALRDDSRFVQPGDVYVAAKGFSQDSHGLVYAEAAVAAGAVAVIYEPVAGLAVPMLDAPLIPVANLALRLGDLAAKWYQQPSAKFALTGITGTDGKTSVAFLLTQAFTRLTGEKSAAMMGTLGYGSLDDLQPATHTTPPPLALQGCLASFAAEQFAYVCMEVSSHALQQNRVGGSVFHTAVLTNLGRDHLDYHVTLEAYAAAKAALFAWPTLHVAVINADDAFGQQLIDSLTASSVAPAVQVVAYGSASAIDALPQSAMVRYVKLISKPIANGLALSLHTSWGDADVQSGLLGQFNAWNVAAVLAVLLSHNVEFAAAVDVLPQLQPVPGRMQRLGGGALPTIVVDYAHTADALKAALAALRPHVEGQLFCVFGCGGDRDKGKRPLMAAAAECGADVVVLTSDNPRTEQPQDIINDVLPGFDRANRIIVELDRRQAIVTAIQQAQTGDVVLVAGKGHEDYQIIGTTKHHFDDSEVALSCLQQYSNDVAGVNNPVA